ncbi:fimbria/pilus periplasmic chaperone [Pantoea endophytica]|nr:fimbria/pilus periplasmic chaperone [Pantoea endophytica]
MNLKASLATVAMLFGAMIFSQSTLAAVALDRTRVIYDGAERSISLNISNENKARPYLAQSWLEDEQGKKIKSPLMALPPVQRIEPGHKSAIKIQSLPAAKSLPQDRESLFYFNLREIPPRSEKQNVLQIALQTRIKLFYRPEKLMIDPRASIKPVQNQLTLKKNGDQYTVINPTGYYVTLITAASHVDGKEESDFKPIMIPPQGSAAINVKASKLGSHPVLSYIDDFGGRPKLTFSCKANECRVTDSRE